MSLTHHLSLSGWGVAKLEEHLWWIMLNVLVLSLDWGVDPLSLVGLVAPVIGLGIALTWLSLLMVAGVVTLVVGVTGSIGLSIQLVEGCMRMRTGFSFKVPLLCFSLKLKMRR